MSFKERKLSFREADHLYAELERQHGAGSISDEEFDVQRRQLMVQDGEGRWWAKSRKTGGWNYHDGSSWVRGTPPGYQPPPPPPPEEESAPDRRPQLEGERLPPSPATLPSGASVEDPDRQKQRRGVPRWAIIAAGLVGVAALAGIGVIATVLGQGSGPEAGYILLKDNTGQLSVEVPAEWKEHIIVDSEGEKGKNWSLLLGEGESAGPSITAVNDLSAWRTGARPHKGTFMVASKKLAQEYTDDELVNQGPNDYSASCQAGTVEDFDRPPYSGKMLQWNNCGGESDHNVLTVAAAPKGRECVVVAQVGGYIETETDKENRQHVLDTFDANCRKID
jgi:hypothetical protein